ncbi:hypothetical protein EVAR_13334_1 [Eumeta japonica]|uniref:Uncharacterized protein n=1 Tax=Eumeta variegata TaxID=151549 RepID=A0A4C1TRU9_EUMVA|nr:hypothetical protein EVAR_13334_1 [Eumeta japonica]
MLGKKSKLSLRNKRTLYLMCIRTVITYACPVYTKEISSLAEQILRISHQRTLVRYKFSPHRDSDLPPITKYMKDAFERFFSITESHSDPLLSVAASFEAPPSYYFIRRSRNIITNPSNDFTTEVSGLLPCLDAK